MDAHNARPNEPVHGVKGFSALSHSMPDFIKGMAIDRMHCVEGGVLKKILTLIFDNKFRNYPFSLIQVINLIDSRIKSIKPPKFVHRMPRSVSDLLHWKASELKHFLFFYSIPVFEGIMRMDYFEHYILLLTAVTMLNSSEIQVFEVAVAENFLKKFVRQFENLYGIQFCSINVHQLLHLCECVRNLGPLWAHTCYEFEDINGKLLKLIHGTDHLDTQVANYHTRFIKMFRHVQELPEGPIRAFCLQKKKQVKIIENVSDHSYSVGAYARIQGIDEMLIINAFANSNIRVDNAVFHKYFRLLKYGQLYVSKMYAKNLQTESFAVEFRDGVQSELGFIYCFVKMFRCTCHEEECVCTDQHFAILQKITPYSVFVAEGDNNIRYNTAKFLRKCHKTNQIYAISIDRLTKVCVRMNVNNCLYIAIPINNEELE